MKRLTLSLCALLLCACGQTRANTQIIASIEADPGVRSRTETLRVIVYGPPYDERGLPITMVRDVPFDMSAYDWPIIVALAPEERDPTRRYRIEAIAQDASELPVATVRAISGYVSEQTLTLPLRLLDRCIGVTCEDPGQTCFGPDDCRDATIDPNALIDGGTSDMDAGVEGCVDAMCDDGFDCTLDFCGPGDECEHVARDVMCDDGNVCTDDTCTGTGEDGCATTPNTIACDDSVYCNGIDVCAGGSCQHPGNPCRGTTTCSEPMGACIGCVTTSDCPTGAVTLGTCTYADETCSEAGSQPRTTIRYECESTICAESTLVDSTSCGLRETDGETCDDGDACIGMDRCRSGVCAPGTCPVDAGVDAGPDAGVDAGRDAGVDAGMEAGVMDAGSDAGPDSGPEAGTDELDSGVMIPDLEGGMR